MAAKRPAPSPPCIASSPAAQRPRPYQRATVVVRGSKTSQAQVRGFRSRQLTRPSWIAAAPISRTFSEASPELDHRDEREWRTRPGKSNKAGIARLLGPLQPPGRLFVFDGRASGLRAGRLDRGRKRSSASRLRESAMGRKRPLARGRKPDIAR